MVYMVKRRVSLGGIQEIEKVTEVWGTNGLKSYRLRLYSPWSIHEGSAAQHRGNGCGEHRGKLHSGLQFNGSSGESRMPPTSAICEKALSSDSSKTRNHLRGLPWISARTCALPPMLRSQRGRDWKGFRDEQFLSTEFGCQMPL